MRMLVWQWGRRGAGPRFAVDLVQGFRAVPGTQALLSLSAGAEILQTKQPPENDFYFRTYAGTGGFVRRMMSAPLLAPRVEHWLREQRVEVALCAMPAPLDLVMARAARRAGIPFAVVVHDADSHPGDAFPLQMRLQRRLLQQADALFALTAHVADGIRQQGLDRGRKLFMAAHTPFVFGPPPPPPGAHGGKLRLLSFGRLLPYKGLDLLANALTHLGPRTDLEVRVVGSGPETAVLAALRQVPGVTVENRWVPEDEIVSLLAWADALVLSHREASQSGVAAAAIAARRWVVATRVGGLMEQVAGEPLALLCDPTPESIAEALMTLLVNRSLPPPMAATASSSGARWREVGAGMVRDVASLI